MWRYGIPCKPYESLKNSTIELNKIFHNLIQDSNLEGTWLEMLLSLKNNEYERMQHIIQLMVAGYDTTSHALTFVCWQLAQNPEMQRRVREEAEGIDTASSETWRNYHI
eukprot:UN07461